MQILDLDLVDSALRTFAAFFCKVIYQLIAWLYELFITIAKVNILSSEDIAPIYQRVTMILTIVMVFYITFEFVKYVVQPDTIGDKEKGVSNLAYKMIIVILLIAFVPRIFSLAYNLQGKIIENQIFSKVILGKKEVDMSTYGRGFSADMFSVFYKVNEEACNGCDSEGVVNFNLNRLRETGDLKYLNIGLNESKKIENPASGKNEETPTIDFDGLLAIIVGALILYILALYCIDVGTRYAQLIFLQIISPVAIMGYLTPKKDNMFSKWTKQCITTYINLFIRIAIIYFVLLICQVLGESYGNGKLFEGLGSISPSIQAFTYIALVMGLLVFANKAPKMLQELFPSSGAAGIGFGLGAKDRIEPTTKALKGTARAVGRTAAATAVAPRAIGGAIKNKTGAWSAVKAMGTGYKNTFGKDGGFRKSGQSIRGSIQKDMDTLEAGGKPLRADLFGGIEAGIAKRQDIRIARLEEMAKKKKAVSSSIGDIKFRAQMDTIGSAITASGDKEAATQWEGVKKKAEGVARRYADGKIDATQFETEMKKIITDFNTTDGNGNASNKSPTSTVSISSFDFELDKKEKWSKVSTAINEAKAAASTINGETYTDASGKTQTIKYNEETFAKDIGDITDAADAAAAQIKASSEYKRAHADAEKSGK